MSEETGIMIKDRIEYWQNKYFEEKEKNKELEISDTSKEKSSMNYYNLYKQEKEKNKELEATLKQTQDSWYEDTKKIELNNECEIALNNRIIDLENELNKEKEKNKKIEEYCRKDFLIF